MVAEAADGVAAVRDTTPDVVLMDVRMPTMTGIEATAERARRGSPTKILILTTSDLDEYVYDAVRAGASGFLLKDVARSDLVHRRAGARWRGWAVPRSSWWRRGGR